MDDQVIFVSGHRTDGLGEPKRFPESRVAFVRQQIRRWFASRRIGPQSVVLVGGARGADLIAAEEALERHACVRLMLAKEAEAFLRGSVITDDPEAYDWEAAFRRVVAAPQTSVQVLPPERTPPVNKTGHIYTATNEWMLDELARSDRPHALLVWNGEAGREGGTGQLADRAQQIVDDPTHQRLRIIDPTPRDYDHRQYLDHLPRRVLSIDGGGLRGVIALQILATIEQQLRDRHDQRNLVLSDYFDYIAGTSTGAIIATGLALGYPVDKIRKSYFELGHSAFRRSLRSAAQGARYGSRPLLSQLRSFFGEDLTLGDPRLQTLLLLVLHRIDTDSPWLLTNCTNAKYNRANRFLSAGGSDRNLDLDLLHLIRGSTAAPTYFPPQAIQVGVKRTVFQDGGVTAFNNPALIAAVMATLPAYGLEWDHGEDKLLVVSVGTGTHAAVAPNIDGPLQAFANLKLLPSVFMNGSAFSQDLLCRVIGNCRFGPPLDNEVGSLVGEQFLYDDAEAPRTPKSILPFVGHYFSYVRYDADLTDLGLCRMRIPRRDFQDVRRMDQAAQTDNWRTIGDYVAQDVDIASHFLHF